VDDDRDVVEAIQAGAVDQYGELVRRHQSLVFRILGRYERNPHRVEDLAQEAFVKAWQALDRFDGRVPFVHWLSRITTHVALDHLRRQRRQREVAWDDLGLGENALDCLQSSEAQPESAGEHARHVLARAMRQLTAEEQLVLTLLEVEDRTVKETSQVTGWSSVLVRVRAHRARKKLARIVAAGREGAT
jgi:RNA polymerase sigma-70 factor, ECF subfamily